MNATARSFFAAAATLASLGASQASAQQHHNRSGHTHHHNHPVVDRHGHVVGQVHHDVRHSGPSHASAVVHSHPHSLAGPAVASPQIAYGPVAHEFGSFSHVDDYATRLETLTGDLLLDLQHNYAHNPGFAETYRETYSIFETARYIHSAEHLNDRVAIASRLAGLDVNFHHIQNDVRGWSRHHHVQVGQLGILTKMAMIEEAIHHLMTDVGVRATAGAMIAPAAVGQVPYSTPGFQSASATDAGQVRSPNPGLPSSTAVSPTPAIVGSAPPAN